MTALASVRRRRTALMLGANLLAIAAVGGMAYAGVTALRNYEGATKVGVTSSQLPVTPAAMLGAVDADDRLTAITVFVLVPESLVGGSIVSVPVTSDATSGGGEQRIPLTQVYAEGGVDALVLAVESVLSIGFDAASVATPPEMETLLAPVAPVTLDLASDVLDGADGTPIFSAGENSLSAAQVVQVLTATTEGEPDTSRRPNVEAVWAGIAASIGAGRTDPDLAKPITSVAEVVDRVFAAPAVARGLPAIPMVDEQNPEGIDVETLDRAEAVFVLASVAASAMTAPQPGLVFRIEAPIGYDERVKTAVGAVLFFGGNVVSVYLGGDVHPENRLLVADSRFAEQTDIDDAYLGTTRTATAEVPIEGVDVVLRLGTVFLDRATDTLPATTSTTEPE